MNVYLKWGAAVAATCGIIYLAYRAFKKGDSTTEPVARVDPATGNMVFVSPSTGELVTPDGKSIKAPTGYIGDAVSLSGGRIGFYYNGSTPTGWGVTRDIDGIFYIVPLT